MYVVKVKSLKKKYSNKVQLPENGFGLCFFPPLKCTHPNTESSGFKTNSNIKNALKVKLIPSLQNGYLQPVGDLTVTLCTLSVLKTDVMTHHLIFRRPCRLL